MAVSIISGDKYPINVDKRQECIDILVSGLDEINNGVFEDTNEMNFIKSILRVLEGVQGHTEAFKKKEIFAEDDGTFLTGKKPCRETYAHWSFSRRGYKLKDMGFTYSLIHEILERKIDSSNFMRNKVKVLTEFYKKNYIPNILYETLFKAPEYTVGGERSYYGEAFGFLRGENVEESMLKMYARENPERNHYRTIKSRNGIVSKLDLFSLGEYLSQYTDIKNKNVILQANRKQFNSIMCLLDIPYNTLENNTYIEVDDSLKIAVNNFMPNSWIFASNKKAYDIITKLRSPNKLYRGLTLVKERGFAKIEEIYDIIDSYFKIMPEGYHLTGRHQGCFLYTGVHKVINEDAEETRPLKDDEASEEVMNTLAKHVETLRSAWYDETMYR